MNRGWRAMDFGLAFKIWGFDHATPTFDTHISVHLLLRITLFWGYCKAFNFPLEEDSQLFPGLYICVCNENTCDLCLSVCIRSRLSVPWGVMNPVAVSCACILLSVSYYSHSDGHTGTTIDTLHYSGDYHYIIEILDCSSDNHD